MRSARCPTPPPVRSSAVHPAPAAGGHARGRKHPPEAGARTGRDRKPSRLHRGPRLGPTRPSRRSWTPAIQVDAECVVAHRLLRSIPGVGARVAAVPIYDLAELRQRDRKSIVSLAGLAPHVSQSSHAPPRDHDRRQPVLRARRCT
ncbi:IS110 family transposase [Methylobacterium sp. WL103]|nr:IS110 family transposase [Methylobacterium sp. WL12]TXM90719.1 IS110 family transposase [Methylobacterium sp. WL103]TXN83508.1 IS110 family transposase [Methylobacterium sp. WL8]